MTVLVHKIANGFSTEDASLAQTRFAKQIVRHLPEFIGQPIIDRRGKSSLRMRQHFPRKHFPHRLSENVLCHRPKPSFQLQARRYTPRHKLSKLTIQKRHPHLYRRSHAHLVVVSEIEARHKNLGVEIKHLVEEVCMLHFIERSPMSRCRIKSDVPRRRTSVLTLLC